MYKTVLFKPYVYPVEPFSPNWHTTVAVVCVGHECFLSPDDSTATLRGAIADEFEEFHHIDCGMSLLDGGGMIGCIV